MVFSDIEGSTLLLSRMGDAYVEALDGQRSVLRAAWSDWNGSEMGTQGDSFFVVFGSVRDAVNATFQGQREMGGHVWPSGERVRVRIGLHTGEPVVHDGGYVRGEHEHAVPALDLPGRADATGAAASAAVQPPIPKRSDAEVAPATWMSDRVGFVREWTPRPGYGPRGPPTPKRSDAEVAPATWMSDRVGFVRD
jgi:hypothetical protein